MTQREKNRQILCQFDTITRHFSLLLNYMAP